MPFHWPTQGISLATGHASTGEMRRWSLRAPARPGDRQSLEREQAQEGHLAGPRASGMHPGGLLRGSGTEAEVPELEGHSRSEGTESKGELEGRRHRAQRVSLATPHTHPSPGGPSILHPLGSVTFCPQSSSFWVCVASNSWCPLIHGRITCLCLCCHMIICVQITLL